MALNNHFDTWVEFVAKQLGILRDVPVRVLHERFDLVGAEEDQTARERVFTTTEFYGREVQEVIERDAARLRECLAPEG